VAWADRFAPAAPAICRPWTPARPARLRVAFLSGDLFPAHAVLRFAKSAIFGLDPARFEVFCFETRIVGRWGAGTSVTFRDVSNLREDAVAKAIAQEDIHVLIDLSGYTVHSGLVALRHRPAPIQASWLGYPATTGLRTIDYRITDAWVDPAPSAEAEYLETVLRLPRTAWCFPFGELPPPVERVGAVRFGSVNRAAKVSDDTLAAWAAVLSGAPGTTLAIKGRGFGSRFARARVEEAMRRADVDLGRVEISGWTNDVQDHFRAYGDLDVVLDTSPYAGTTTTCEALGSGVPVVTLAGDAHVSRVGVSLLSQVGLEDLVATSWSDYVERAIKLANDAPRRAELRRTLRATCEASPLGDAEGFARDFGDAVDSMWEKGPRERP
jgi:predicted O-linked N-acetylglucosamine transferase (SPINDLY family)